MTSPEQRLSRISAIVLVTSIVVAIGVRLALIGGTMHYDEAYSFTQFASQRVRFIFEHYDQPNNHLLHTLLMHGAFRVFGNHPWALRLPALVAGILIVPATFLAIRQLYEERVAAVAAAFVAVSAPLVGYSVNARGYSMIVLASLLLIWLGAQGLGERRWIGFGIVAALGFLTIPIMVYPIVGVSTWVLLRPAGWTERRAELLRLAGAAGIVAVGSLGYIPAARANGLHQLIANPYVASRGFSYVRAHLLSSFGETWASWHRDLPLPFAILLLGAVVAGVVLHARVAAGPPLLPVMAGVALLLVLAQRVVPYPRTWLFLVPVVAATAVAGCRAVFGSLGGWKTTGLILAAVVALGSWTAVHERTDHFGEGGVLEHPGAVVALVRSTYAGRPIFALRPINAPLRYYGQRAGIPHSAFQFARRRGREFTVVIDTAVRGRGLDRAIAMLGRVRDVRQIGALGTIRVYRVRLSAG